MKQVLIAGKRPANATSTLEHVELEEMIEALGADSFRLIVDNNGNERLHVVNSQTGEYYSIKLGDKVALAEDGDARIKEVVNNYRIYCGVNDGRSWFTFGPIASITPSKLVSIASVLGNVAVGAD